jgi:hypothetical protein
LEGEGFGVLRDESGRERQRDENGCVLSHAVEDTVFAAPTNADSLQE